MKKALILMTRVPIPGHTKTRLMSIYTKEECMEIHFCFLKDIFNTYDEIKEDIDIYLTYTPKESFHIMKDIIPNYITCFEQEGNTLGDKMKNAINKLLNKGYEEIILTGSDIPQMQVDDINIAFNNLEKSDMVISPTTDGGYYLIGMKNTIEEVFDSNLSWGNKTVFESTIDICNKNNISLSFGNKLTDIDTKDDINVLYNEVINNKFKKVPINTFNFIINGKDREKYA